MAHEETIRIYRSDVPGAEPPSLTYGELAANLADRKVFVGGTGGTANMIVLLETPPVAGLPLATTGASGVASFFGDDFIVSATGHVFLFRDFIDVYSGDGIDVIGGGGKVELGQAITIRNIGVTSVNGATGSINLIDFVQGEGIATRSQGNKTILTNIGVTGISAGHTGIALSGTTGNVQILNMGVLSIDGLTGHIDLASVVGETGDTVLAGLAIGVARSGNAVTINNLGVTSFNGATGAVLYSPPLATNTGTTGVASFNNTHFTVSSGNVSISDLTMNVFDSQGGGAVLNTVGSGIGTLTITGSSGIQTTVSGGGSALYTIVNTGVTGISAGHTGIALIGATGDVRIFNMGVLSIDGQTGHIDLASVVGETGDTVQSGLAIDVVRSGNTVTVNNLGVTSFNGLTGAVSLTGDSAATIGAENGRITVRNATDSLTGVASFNNTHFTVLNGSVSISDVTMNVFDSSGSSAVLNTVGGSIGSFTITGSSGIRTAVSGGGSAVYTVFNTGVTGISAGHTGIALSGTTGNVQILNMGVLSINGQTGHYTLPASGPTGDTVSAGVGVSAVRTATNSVTINNLGVTSFNGQTGAVTGVSSLNTNTGAVTISITGDGGAISQYLPSSVDTIAVGLRARLATTSLTGVASFNSSNFTVNTGQVSLVPTMLILGDEAGATESVAFGDTLTVTGGQGVDFLRTGKNAFAIRGVTASTTVVGVASYNPSHFSVNSSAQVSLASAYTTTGNTVLAGSGIAIPASADNTRTIVNVGVTGIGFGTSDAGLTGKINLTAGTSVTLDLLANNTIRINSTGVVGATGDTVVAGVGISTTRTGGTNVVTVNNMGVTSFNGLTGAVTLTGDGGAISGRGNNTIGVRLATTGVTGVASFNTFHFDVVNGEVSLDATYQATGDTVSVSSPITISRTQNDVRLGVNAASSGASGVASFDPINFSVTTTGHVTLQGTLFTIRDEKNTTDNVSKGETITITGGPGVDFRYVSKNNFAIQGVTADTSTLGVASFNPTFFSVSSGAVSLASPFSVIGVTGISAGHTGIALSGTTGNVQIRNMGVHTFNGSTGHITFNPVTGDTITAGLAIGVSVVSGNNKRIDNLGVTSFNGATGAVRYEPPLATLGVSGVASFDSGDFAVSGTGHVTIKALGVGNAQLENSTFRVYTNDGSGLAGGAQVALGGDITLTNIGVTGISAGHTGIALSGTTGNVRIFNTGILSINGQTGHYTLPAGGATGDTVVAGVGISAIRNGNQVTVNNMGVTSFNGVTGAVSYAAPYASASVTGVASFPTADFGVSTLGVVSLTGNVARTNLLNTFSASQQFSGGFVVSAGATFTSTISSIGNISTTQNISAQGTVLGSNILRWESVTANRSLSGNYGVFANKPVASGQLGLTMASSSATVGASIRITGITGSWRIVLDDNHTVYFGNTTAQTTVSDYAYMESTHYKDTIEMVCFNAGQGGKYEWNVLSSVGSINFGTISRLGGA